MSDTKYIGLREWAAKMFAKPPHYNTLLNWVHNGSISPKPQKMGKRWYVKPNAEYQG
jgi:hypothetical protein